MPIYREQANVCASPMLNYIHMTDLRTKMIANIVALNTMTTYW